MSRLGPPLRGHGAVSRGDAGVFRAILIVLPPRTPREPRLTSLHSQTSVGNVILDYNTRSDTRPVRDGSFSGEEYPGNLPLNIPEQAGTSRSPRDRPLAG